MCFRSLAELRRIHTFLEYAAKKSILTGEAAMPWRQAT